MHAVLFSLFAIFFILSVSRGQSATEVWYASSADGTQQPAMFYAPDTDKPVPMVVALHSWSADYKQTLHGDIEKWCAEKGWAYMHPNFRGEYRTPESTGSEQVVGDILSAVEYAKKAVPIDASSIYLVGTSGGGFTSLLMAGRYPEMWAGVSAWVPIYDLAAWHRETKAAGLKYTAQIEASCGGAPGASSEVDAQYAKRSPKAYLENAKSVKLHINAGIRDGHDGSVPVGHSLYAFNAVADRRDRISEDDIRSIVAKAAIPSHLAKTYTDPSYGEKPPLFRKSSGNATVTLFDGAHELVASAAIAWIEEQYNSKR